MSVTTDLHVSCLGRYNKMLPAFTETANVDVTTILAGEMGVTVRLELDMYRVDLPIVHESVGVLPGQRVVTSRMSSSVSERARRLTRRTSGE